MSDDVEGDADELRSYVYIDPHPDAHIGVYDHEWAGRLMRRTHGTPLSRPVFVLCEIWKSTSNAYRMPWIMLNSLQTFHDRLFEDHTPASKMVIDSLTARFSSEPGLGLRRMQLQKMREFLKQLHGDAVEKLSANRPVFDRHEVWKGLAKLPEFALGASSLRETCFCNWTFGFENYWKSCLDAMPATPASPGDKGEPGIMVRFVRRFGEAVHDQVFNREIMLAREVRHVFVHNGGRVDEKLQKAGIETPIGEKVPMPNETVRDVARQLEIAVDVVTDAARIILAKA